MNQFSIDYAEYYISELLRKEFKKRDNFSVSIPILRQQKNYDLLLLNPKGRKYITIQVKSSRTWVEPENDLSKDFHYYAWQQNHRIKNNYADYYFIYISYPLFDTKTFRPKTSFATKILVFNKKEMRQLLGGIKKTKSGRQDKFFDFAFNIDDERIFGDRGFDKRKRPEFTKNLFRYKVRELRRALR